jgi:hypothetical protein
MKTRNQRILVLVTLVSTLIGSMCADAEIAVIVRADSHVPYDDLLIEKIFLVQTLSLPDGSKAAPVHQKDGSTIHSDFMLSLLNKAPAYIRSGWSKLTFTGALKNVKELSDDEAVIKYVESTPNGIGYVDAKKVKGNVRVIMKL